MIKTANYRVTFSTEKIDYFKNFSDCRKYISILTDIFKLAAKNKIDYIWFFFEPYVEITWIDETGLFVNKIKKYFKINWYRELPPPVLFVMEQNL